MSTAELIDNPEVCDVKRNVRVEDKMKLRELELQTQYELKYLSDNFKDLKQYVKDNREAENIKFEQINKKVNWLWWMMVASLAGADADMVMKLLRLLPM